MIFRTRNKFKAVRTIVDGISFPSRGESSLYASLKYREKLGDIKDVQVYHTVTLSKALIKWKVDGSYFCLKRNQTILSEFKGIETEGYRLKKRLYAAYGELILEVYKQNGRGVFLDETIIPDGWVNPS